MSSKKRVMGVVFFGVVTLCCASANALIMYNWNFTDSPSDYYIDGDSGSGGIYMPVITQGVGAYVPPRPDDGSGYGGDWAAVFARINTQAPGLTVDDILGGGFTVTGINNPSAVYGSLYLSPTGGSGSNVLINLSPMGITGSGGNLGYAFNGGTEANVLTWSNSLNDWVYAQPFDTLDFNQVVSWLDASSYSGDYAAFFGPQIGMSGTSGTTFTVTDIYLNANSNSGSSSVPEPASLVLLGLGIGGMAAARKLRGKNAIPLV